MRTLRKIAKEIRTDWQLINDASARNALKCMDSMGQITEPFGADSNGYPAVGTFFSHSVGWRGETARRVKKELRTMCGHPRP